MLERVASVGWWNFPQPERPLYAMSDLNVPIYTTRRDTIPGIMRGMGADNEDPSYWLRTHMKPCRMCMALAWSLAIVR
ncbi:hypothetical protein C1I98_33915 [Spongiactinospora gelatinilytica]|uniref:Uncharacterized protein n=1 Tax=Spongiactinospora gelatinilytica TaxID=2666298 RepID=A0A2W2GHV5_9ACTN|nr:hypothetical protein [Spongiactinospora gelatinilytica]PZG26474.1 hypothetical protein C1I98_33915 [Spongiactinospora gelatinilytica]